MHKSVAIQRDKVVVLNRKPVYR